MSIKLDLKLCATNCKNVHHMLSVVPHKSTTNSVFEFTAGFIFGLHERPLQLILDAIDLKS